MTVIDDVLNDCIDEEYYVYSSIGTQTEWHFVNVSGYLSTQVRITDPNDAVGNVWYDIDILYSANYAHSRQAIIW